MPVFNNYGDYAPRRSTLALVAFSVVVVAFTAFALTWHGFSGQLNTASADPGVPGEADGDAHAEAGADAHHQGEDALRTHAEVRAPPPPLSPPRPPRRYRSPTTARSQGLPARTTRRVEVLARLSVCAYEPLSSIQLWNHIRSTQPPTNGTVRALRIGQK